MNAKPDSMPWHQRRACFTLIELLAVIAVLLIMASLLLPALRQAQLAARTSVCSNRLKQLGVATTLYADDFDDHLVPSWAAWRDPLEASWYDQLMVLSYLQGAWRNGPYIEGDMLACPVNPNWYAQTAAGAIGLNYAINEALTRDLKNGFVPTYFRLTQIQRPTFKIVLGEPYIEPSWGNNRCNYTLFTYANMPGGTGYYHKGRTQAVYADGHVKLLSLAAMAPPAGWHWWYRYEPTWSW